MMYLWFILRFFLIQGISLSVQDLYDSSWSVQGWSATTAGGSTTSSYNTITTQCNNQNMLKLTDSYLTYTKTYSIQDQEFYKLYIDIEVYFYLFTQTSINIFANSNLIYSQSFSSSILTLNNICNTGSDSQFIISQDFYTSQSTLLIQIQYIQNILNTNSFIGIKNLNIYSNGIPLIGGCPIQMPLSSQGTCVKSCTTTYPYLTGEYFTLCASGLNTSYGQIRYYSTPVANFVISNSPPNATVSSYFDGSSKLINSNVYTSSIFHSNLFTNQFQSASPIYQANFNTQGNDKLQFYFTFYAFGTWDEGSFVKIYIAGSSIYKNNMISISQTYGKLISSTQSFFYDTNVTQNGMQQVAKKTLISFSAHYYGTNSVQFCFTQVLQGSTASYGFGDIVYYKAAQDTNFNFPTNTDIYGLPYTCINGLYAYNGTCVTTCPIFSFTSNTNFNCTDYSISESSLYNSALQISSNAYGTYIIKIFHQNNFQQSDVDSLFQTKPPTSKNYLNSESYSFIQSKKILGGYNSWGYGTYLAKFSNLIAHFQVRIFFTLYLIDGWQIGDTFTYQVDGVVLGTYTSNPSVQYQGLSTLDTIHVISGRKVNHGSSTLSISFNCNIAQKDSSKASCGIQNLFVLLDQSVNILCPLSNQFFSYTTQNCETCITASCQLFPSNGITAKCSIGCLTCTSSSVCTACDTSNGYQLSGNACTCQSNYIMESSICQKCYYQCNTCSGTAYNQCNTCDSTRTKSGNICSCNLNYQDIYSQTICAAITSTCHYSCSMCFGLQYYQCLSCPSSSNRTYQSSSNTCPCDTNYSDNGVANCLPPYTCDISCLTCNAAGSTNCQSCDSTKHRTNLSSGSCPCDLGYNDILNPGNACQANYNPCHYTCQTCYGTLNTNCLTCSSLNFRTISSNSCPCISGYVDISVSNCAFNYTPCIYSCLTCFGAAETQCITCPATRNLNVVTTGTNQKCDCQDGLYNNNVATCAACDSTCKTCTAADDSSCSSCESTSNRTQSGSTCPCSSGYNDILSPGNACVSNYTPCHYSCSTCYQSLNNNCLTCNGTNHRTFQSTTKICQCDANYSDIGVAACLLNYSPCHNDCLTCYGAASNQCSSCGVGRTINIVNLGVNSSCPCSTNHYYSSGSSCLACASTCLTCNGGLNNNCTSCDSLVFRQLHSNTCPCLTGYNELFNPGTCVINQTSCHASCVYCFGSNSNQCITCNPNRTLNLNTCPCSIGSNEILNPGTCVTNYSPCHEQCDTCFGGLNNNCITCDSSKFRTFDYNTNTCPCNLNYIDIGQVLCVQLYSPCYTSCNTCFGNLIYQCLTCPSTRSLNQVSSGNQSCDCNPKYYEISGASQCSPCHYSCATCNGGTNLNCQTCNTNRIFTAGACPCIANYNDLKGTLNDCQQNYSPCHQSCLTCFGGNINQCIDCPLQSLRSYNNTSNTCDCPSGYDGSQQVCTYICHNTCLFCNGPTQADCLTCNTVVRWLSGTSCLCNTGTNDKLNPPTCIADLTSCYAIYVLTCFGNSYNQALRCDSNLNRILDKNICNCDDGYFEDAQNGNICTLCHYSCQTCQTTFQNCLTCSTQKFRQIFNNSCPCILNYKEVNQNCITCTNSDCLTCDNQQNCLTCVSQIKQVLNGLCICIDGYYQQGSNCYQCDATCLTCDGQGIKQCLSCDNSVFRIIEFGQCVCMTGYQEDSNQQCVDCQSNEGILIFRCQYKNSQDGVWTYGEQCDDGNNDPRDGCDNQITQPNYSCINIINEPSICYKCPANCIKCIYVDDQVLCSSCSDTYYNAQLSCIKCSDSQCQYCITPSICSVCINDIIPQNGKCLNCQNGFYQAGNSCQPECGDGIKTFNEQCDDGNLQNGDGCSNQCLIEENFVCQTSSQLSTCKINPAPKLIINQLKTLNSTIQHFEIQSDQSVFYYDIVLMNFYNDTQFILEYLIKYKSNLTILQIDVNVTFLKSFNDIDLTFYVQGQIYNEYNQNLSNRYLSAKIANIQVMNQQESQISSQVSKMGEGLLITFASFSLFQLLLGGVQQFVQFLNMIQKLQYIKFINIDFPPNLYQFLQIFNRFSLQPLLQFAQINNILVLFGDEQMPYVQPSVKFQENGINAYFLQNIQDYFLTLLSGLLINYLFSILVKLLEDIKNKFGQREFFLMKQLYNIVWKLQKFLINYIQFSQNYGFIQLTVLSCFDIQFAILIQLSVQNYDDTNLAINCILAYGFQVFFIVIVIKCLSFKDDELNNKFIWQSSFCSIRMIESIIFMFSIINLQSFPQCQVIIISLSSFSISFYILTFKPLKASLNNYKLIIQEFALFVTNMSFVGYIYFPTEINQINLGWFQIASYGSMILANLAIELYSNAKTIRTMCQQQQNRKYESPRLLI